MPTRQRSDTAAGQRVRDTCANRAAILAAARRRFSERGYARTTIRDVMRDTGPAVGNFHDHFRDKASLFRAIVDAALLPLQTRILAGSRPGTGIEALIHDACYLGMREVGANPDFFAMMFRNEAVLRTLYDDTLFGLMMRPLRAALRDAVARGTLPAIDIDLLTTDAFGAGHEHCRLIAAQPQYDVAAAADHVARLLVTGLGPRPQAATPMIRIGPRKLRGAAR